MSKARTKDERFVLSLYEEASKSGDVHVHLDRYYVGKLAGLQPKAVNTICNLLLQANFIKKGKNDDIFLTKNGEDLALRIMSE